MIHTCAYMKKLPAGNRVGRGVYAYFIWEKTDDSFVYGRGKRKNHGGARAFPAGGRAEAAGKGKFLMAAFFADLLERFVWPSFLERVERKFHYEKSRREELFGVAVDMLPLLVEEAFWERQASCALPESSLPDGMYEAVLISLGGGIDRLQEDYGSQGRLLESYMLEGLAGELLLDAYGAYNRYVQAHTDRHVARYHFPGSEAELPLEMLPGLLEGFNKRVTCNGAYCMIPKKSVVLIAELTQDESVRCQSICTNCSHIGCPNRIVEDSPFQKLAESMADVPFGYGYSRISKAR